MKKYILNPISMFVLGLTLGVLSRLLNIFPFCIGMLITYYFVAHITNGVYSEVYIIGWTVFALASPLLAYFTWIVKEKSVFAIIIKLGIIVISTLSSIVFFDRLRIDDYIIIGILVYYLFVKKIKR